MDRTGEWLGGRRAALSATAGMVLLLVAGCGPPDGTTAAPDRLEGEWRLIEGTGPGGAIPVLDEAPITLRVDGLRGDGREWHGQAACNSYGSTVEVDGDRLRIEGPWLTEMACYPEEIMDSQQAYVDAFPRADGYAFDDGRLVLTGPEVRLVYDEVPPEPDAALVGTEWVLNSLIDGFDDVGMVSDVTTEPDEPTLRLDEDGRFRAHTGCREVLGGYELEGEERVRFTDLVVEDAVCDGLTHTQDEHVLAVLEAAESFTLQGRGLLLRGGDAGLQYHAPPAA